MAGKVSKLSDLTPDAKNANKGSERGLALLDKSLRTYGAGRSILVDKHGRVIAGNKTHQAAIDIGLDDAILVPSDGTKLVAVQRTDLDLETDPAARELAYADNRISELDLVWSIEQVVADIDAGVNLDGLFTGAELEDLLGDAFKSDADAEPQIDKAEELRVKWGMETGQLWQLGGHRLIVGDCTDKAIVERVMGGERAALVVTDPPYGVEYADKNKFLNAIGPPNRIETPIHGDHGTKAEVQAMWRAAFEQMGAVMLPGAVVYCFMPQGGDQMMMMMMQGAGIEPRHELIWLKNNHVLGRVDYAYKHEPILYAWKEGGHKFYGGFQTSILEVDKPTKSDMHPTTKPAPLIEHLVTNSSRQGEIVLDPFLGSGTTIIACENLGRKCRAVEISPAYCAVAIQRWVDMSGGEPVLA